MGGYPDYTPPNSAASPEDIATAVEDYLTLNPPGIPDHNDTTLRNAADAHPTSAITDFDVDVDARIDAYHVPFNASVRVHNPVSNYGGTVGSGTATIAAFSTIPVGRNLWLQGQTNSADNGFYTHDGGGVFTIGDVQPLDDLAYVGREIVVGTDLEFVNPATNAPAPTLWVVTSPDGVVITTTRTQVRPDQLTDILSDYTTTTDVADAIADHVAENNLTIGATHPASSINYDGLGLIDGAESAAQGLDQLEGTIDRVTVVSAYSTTNITVATYTGGAVSPQPTLSDGAQPVNGSDVWLFGQTTPSENGPYFIDASTGQWTKYTHPNRFFDPAGNLSMVVCNAPGTAAHGVRFVCLDDDRTKSRRAATSTLATPSGDETWYRLGPMSSTLTTNPSAPPTTHTHDTLANVAQNRILGRTSSGSGDSEELTAAQTRSLLGVTRSPSLHVSGQYTATGNISGSASGLTSNRLYYLPFVVSRSGLTFDRIALNHAATTAGASSVARLGVYTSVNDLPAALISDFGTIDLTTAAALKHISISWSPDEGLYWLAAVAQVTSGSPTFTVCTPSMVVPSSDGTNNGTKFEGSVTGALPSTATPGAANTTSPPAIYLRLT